MTTNPNLGNHYIDYDNQDGVESGDDGVIDAYYPPNPAPKDENPWKSLEDYAKGYNEAHGQEMYDNYSAMQKGYNDADEAAKAKARNVNARNVVSMTGWYKKHPGELSDIMYAGAEHDEAWYREHRNEPNTISRLIVNYKEKENAIKNQILSENDGLIDEKAAAEMARKLIRDEYEKSLAKKSDGYMGNPGDKPKNPDQNPNHPDDNSDDEGNPERSPVEIGEIQLDEINEKIEQIDKDKIKKLEEDLKELLYGSDEEIGLAELYARNRRLVVGKANKARFKEVQGKYGKLLDEYLQLKAEQNHTKLTSEAMSQVNSGIESKINEIKTKLTEFAGGDLENTEKTQEEIDAEKQRLIDEANQALTEEYGELMNAVKSKVNAGFIKDLIENQLKMEDATIDALDNGTVCRKIVHKVINNKAVKGVLMAAGIAGLAVTGVGVATGAVAVGIGFTASGVAAGAAKGAGSGLLMSRQDSKNSNIRGFSERNEAELEKRLEGIDVLQKDGQTDGVKNVAGWIMNQYNESNRSDRSSNIKKTAIATGLGAIIGGAMSGVHFNTVTETPQTTEEIVGYEPDQIRPQITEVVHKQGTGMNELFREMGGQGDLPTDILNELSEEFGLELGKSGWTYPGSVSEWPAVNQAMFESLTNKCIARGLIPTVTIPGQAIYNTVTDLATDTVPSQFHNFIVRGLEAVLPANLASVVGGIDEKERSRRPESQPPASQPEDIDIAQYIHFDNKPNSNQQPSESGEPTETTDSEPTGATETGSSEGSAETEETNEAEKAEEAVNAYVGSIKRALDAGFIGSSEDLKYFYNDPTNSISDDDYQSYWDSLSYDGKRVVEFILNNSSEVPFAQPFRSWLARHDAAAAGNTATA